MNNFLLPTNFDEISDTFKAKIKEKYGITDTQFQGSNVSILADIMAYAATLIDTNMNFGINESILSTATTRKNITNLAREIGYEPAFRRSFKYEIRLKAKKGGLIEIPKFTKFSGGKKDYYFLDDSKSMLFGDEVFITIINQDKFNNLKVRNGTVAGDFILSDDSEIFEVLSKSSNGDQRMLLNAIGLESISKYSKIKTSFYKNNSDQYLKLAEIETFVVDDNDPNDPILICQLKNIDTRNFPPLKSDVLKLKFFTDDILKGSFSSSFNGFTAYDYNEVSQIIKFKINDNIISEENKKYYMNDIITPFRKKKFCLFFDDNTELKFDESQEFAILNDTEPKREITLIVTEGKLLSWKDNKELERVVDAVDAEKGYINLDIQNVEEDGVFLEISRVNANNELILHQPWSRRKSYLPESEINREDTTFLVLENFTSKQSYLKVYTKYADVGTQFYPGNIFYFTILTSSGADGACNELMSFENEDLEVIPFYQDENSESVIYNKLFSNGSNEESLTSIKQNAPIFKNLAERLVTKNDYKTYCKKFQFVEQTQVWGGEELDNGQQLGHVYFSFIPKSRSKEFESDENNEVFTLKNRYERDLFFLPQNQIISQNQGGSPTSIFSELDKKKIITLQFHNINPTYLDFILDIKVSKYLANISEKELRGMVFDGVREYFNEIERFDSEIYKSNIIKYIDRKFNNETGISIKINLEVSMTKDDFNEDGYNENETQSKKYKLSTLFEFPVGGIFEDNVLNHSGSITQYGKVIKERIPIISNTDEGFLKKGDIIDMDFANVSYDIIEAGIKVTKTGNISEINSSVLFFSVPIIYKSSNNDQEPSYKKQKIGQLVVYPNSSLIYLEIFASESSNSDDLNERLALSIFNERKFLKVEHNNDLIIRRNTFPRLMRVNIK